MTSFGRPCLSLCAQVFRKVNAYSGHVRSPPKTLRSIAALINFRLRWRAMISVGRAKTNLTFAPAGLIPKVHVRSPPHLADRAAALGGGDALPAVGPAEAH